jgi:hypothetical protein
LSVIFSVLERVRDWVWNTTLTLELPGIKAELELPALIYYAFRFIISKLSWLGVRAVGNLHLLTRASYYSLFIVPIIAGAWPFIRNSLNNYNESIESAAKMALNSVDLLDQKINALSRAGESATMSQVLIHHELGAVSTSLREISSNYTYLLHDVNMPTSFAVAFFAALSVATGHLIFQIFCPEEVKRSSLKDYILGQLSSAKQTRSEVSLLDDIDLVANRSAITPDNLLSRLASEELETKDILRAIAERRIPDGYQPDQLSGTERGAIVSRWRQNIDAQMVVTDVAARLRYTGWITQNIGAALAAVFLYFMAIFLLLIIVGQQIINVVTAVGWIS